MDSKIINLGKFIVCIFGITVMVLGCSKTDFQGGASGPKGSKFASDPSNGASKTPESPSINKPGWIGKPTKDEVDSIFRKGDGDSDSSQKGGGLFAGNDGVLWLPCANGKPDAGEFAAKFSGAKGTTVRVAGEFCPTSKASGETTVVFIIDHSASMEPGASEGPNDPTTAGSCGRLKAAMVLADRYSVAQGVKVKVGVGGFSDSARVQMPLTDLEEVRADLSGEMFCNADGKFARTNYGAAFSTTASLLAGVEGQKVVYFISDGSPTVGGADPRQSGLTGAEQLKAVPDVTLFALFVGYTAGKANNPQQYLEQITGDPNLVKVTGSAEELVKAAGSVLTPGVELTAKDIAVQLAVEGTTKDIALEKFGLRDDKSTNFIWATEAFELIGKAGSTTLNELTVSGKTLAGDALKSVAKIEFSQQN